MAGVTLKPQAVNLIVEIDGEKFNVIGYRDLELRILAAGITPINKSTTMNDTIRDRIKYRLQKEGMPDYTIILNYGNQSPEQ